MRTRMIQQRCMIESKPSDCDDSSHAVGHTGTLQDALMHKERRRHHSSEWYVNRVRVRPRCDDCAMNVEHELMKDRVLLACQQGVLAAKRRVDVAHTFVLFEQMLASSYR